MLFNKGDVVMCIDDGIDNQYRITKGKYYIIESNSDSKVIIKNDKGVIGTFWLGRFNHTQQIREEKLKQLGIE